MTFIVINALIKLYNKVFLDCISTNYFYMTPLYLAIKMKNIEYVKLLLSNDKIDVNRGYVFSIEF